MSALTGDVVTTTSPIERELDAGNYTVFERVGSQHTVGPVSYSESDMPSIRPQDVVVTGPDGEPVEAVTWDVDETLQRGDDLFAGAAGFTADRAGRYTIEIAGEPTDVVIARRFFDGTASALVTLAVGAVTGAIAVIALTATVLVRAKRRTALP